MKTKFLIVFAWLLLLPLLAQANINIIAAENIYGSVVNTIGGSAVNVTSILNNPNQDPHLFSVDPQTAKAFHNAQLIIINGAGYDPWADNLAKTSRAKVMLVNQLPGITANINPHLWYSLANMALFAKQLTLELSLIDPSNKALFSHNLMQFLTKLHHLQQQENNLRSKLTGIPITATEPIAGYLAEDLGLKMLNFHFQLSVMNNVEPSVRDRAQMIQSIQQHQVRLIIYNQQVSDPVSEQMKSLAATAHIPVVGVTELLPNGQSYLSWMADNIDKVSKPLLAA